MVQNSTKQDVIFQNEKNDVAVQTEDHCFERKLKVKLQQMTISPSESVIHNILNYSKNLLK